MAPYEEHEFTYANGEKKIFYLAAGPKSGPLLIFIHGWPAIAKTWKPQIDTFSSLGFRVVAPDMPGKFLDPRPARPNIFSRLVQDMAGLRRGK
jgi:soluble epoxide hydrolase/lipid-phosphate phosphatase